MGVPLSGSQGQAHKTIEIRKSRIENEFSNLDPSLTYRSIDHLAMLSTWFQITLRHIQRKSLSLEEGPDFLIEDFDHR